MPTGNKYVIVPMIKLIEQINPKSVFDVGIGFGKWGFLLREYLDVWDWDETLYENDNDFKWKRTIDGAEICEEYIKDLQHNIYDNIYTESILDAIDKIKDYDLFILGDVIEHFDKEQGHLLLKKCFAKANKAIIVSTPITFCSQGDACGNSSERHKSLWRNKDFKRYGNVQTAHIKGNFIAVISKIDKQFKFENRYKFAGIVNRFVAAIQARNIKKYGIEGFDRSFLMKMYNIVQEYREKRLKILNA